MFGPFPRLRAVVALLLMALLGLADFAAAQPMSVSPPPVVPTAPAVPKVSAPHAAPMLRMIPSRLDVGIVQPGQPLTRRIEISNAGQERLSWKAHPGRSDINRHRGRYVSLYAEEARGSGSYALPAAHGGFMEISGRWHEMDGWPVLNYRAVLKYRFAAPGLTLAFWREPIGGRFSVYVDNALVTHIDAAGPHKEWIELNIARDLGPGGHTVTITGAEGRTVLDGFRLVGTSVQRGATGWVTLLPDSGVTTRETDYVTVRVDTSRLSPGVYGEAVSFTSNGGYRELEVYAEVPSGSSVRLIDVHRYGSGSAWLYTASPRSDSALLRQFSYRDEGVAFRLYPAGTPGTVEFYRWQAPDRGLTYYSYEKADGARLPKGYRFDGPMGNIATSRLSSSRPLYRWYDPAKGAFFFSLDVRGEGVTKKGYRFNGIAGYVR